MALIEGYFDESGDLGDDQGVFCIAGYFLAAEDARRMDEAWAGVLAEHGLPYFHMVDCAHGSAPFDRMDKAERALIATKLIAIIKEHNAHGFAVIADRDVYVAAGEDSDPYTSAADMAVEALQANREYWVGPGRVACFFESGHSSQGRAYTKIAEKVRAGLNASVTFDGKEQLPLLQAADLLAWQVLKYVRDRKAGTRPPRKDFMSLMEHEHLFFHVGHDESGERVMALEMWPLSRRAPDTASLTFKDDGPITYVMEAGDPVPIVMPGRPVGWRIGGPELLYVKYQALGRGKELYIAFDMARALETVSAMLMVCAEKFSGDARGIASVVDAEIGGDDVRLLVDLGTGIKFPLLVSRENFDSMIRVASRSDERGEPKA